jgi:PAS domain S-box-containing protein
MSSLEPATDLERLATLAPSLLSSTDAEGRLTYVNRAWHDLLGWHPEELLGRPLLELIHPDDSQRLDVLVPSGERPADEVIELELRLQAKDDRWHRVDWRVRLEADCHYAAGQPSRAESRMTNGQEVSGIGSFEVDRDSLELSWSDECYRIAGLEPGSVDITPERAIGFSHPEDAERVSAHWRQLVAEPAALNNIEFRVQRADGAERIVYLHSATVDGRVVGTIQDVTESRRARQALEASESRYRALMEQVPAIVYTAVPGPDGSWDFVSPHIERMLGYPAHEWTGNSAHWFAAVHPADRSRVVAAEARIDGPGAKLLSEYRMFAADGRIVHVRDEGTAFENERGELRLQGLIVDVTESKRAEQALAASEERYRSIVDTSQNLIFIVSPENEVTFVNHTARSMLGYEPEELLGRPFTDFQPPAAATRDVANAESVLAGETLFDMESQLIRKDGAVVDVSFNASVLRDGEGTPVGIMGSARDVTETRRHAGELRQKHDQLQSIIDNSPLVVFAKDRELRHLLANREFEENLGLEPGWVIGKRDADFLPEEIASALEANDGRVLETGEAIEVEETVRARGQDHTFLSYKFPLQGEEEGIYGVCGIGIDITERKAREDDLRSKVEWSFRIRKAIADDRLVLHSQPIVDIASGHKVQEELLLRMLPEEGDGLIMPDEFLPEAERFGLSPGIDRWVVARAVQLARSRRVEVNLSAQSIGESTLTTFIENLLEEAGTDPSNLVFEITETTAAQDLTQARALADRLMALGCGFALDDFGTGYGSFTYLKHLPVSYIKIDMDFVRSLDSDVANRRVVKAIVDVAGNFDIKTIAEGVESQGVMDLLKGLGVDYAQGYLLGKPAALETDAG